jgi:hypothetical protein
MLCAFVKPLSSQAPSARVPTQICQRKATEQHGRFGGRISRNKYCEDKHPRGNHGERFKIDQTKQDLKDHM